MHNQLQKSSENTLKRLIKRGQQKCGEEAFIQPKKRQIQYKNMNGDKKS